MSHGKNKRKKNPFRKCESCGRRFGLHKVTCYRWSTKIKGE